MKGLSAFVFVCSLALPLAAAQPLTIYVARNGNDKAAGLTSAPTATDSPLATINEALIHARRLRQSQNKPEAVRIEVRNGEYELEEPLFFSTFDSGTNGFLTVAAYPGEKPILSGGSHLRAWRRSPSTPAIWELALDEVKNGHWYFRELFVNGQRKQRARSPNKGFYRIQGPSPYEKPARLPFKPGEIKKEWAQAGDVEAVALIAWSDFRFFIRSVDDVGHIATLSGEARPSNHEEHAQYYIENASDALDQPGEWHLDRHSGLLRYWPEENEDMNTAEVIAPRLASLISIKGTSNDPVRGLRLDGLTFSYSDWEMPKDGYADTQAAIAIGGDIHAQFAVACSIENCTLSHLAGYGIELGRGCQEFKISHNDLFDLGAGGVRLGETARREPGPESCRGHLVADNHIHQLGRIFPSAIGVLILQSGQNRVAHNHIHDLYYSAISIGWNWGYQETPCYANTIEFNHLHDIGQGRLSDMGAVYSLGIQKGTVIRNNLIHDVNAFTYGGWGLYTDEGSSDILLENNVVYRTKSAGFHQHYGRDNILRNNIFAYGKEFQLMRTRAEDHNSFFFQTNIVYFDSGELLGSNWSNDHYQMDGNIYFDARFPSAPENMRFAGVSLPEWQKRGHDLHSIIADPLFVDPARGDFTLKPGSPALKLGFKPIDLSQVGIRPSASN